MAGTFFEVGVLESTIGSAPPAQEADSAPREQARDRLADIDRTKGFAIALVVWGHTASFAPAGSLPAYYLSIHSIYNFHMPLFMYLSGFVYFHARMQDRFWTAPLSQIGKRFDRLIVPFLAFGIIIILGKYLLGQFVRVPGPVESIGAGLQAVITNEPSNPSTSIWYLLVIFVYSIVTPILWRVGRGSFAFLIAIGLAAWAVTLPEAFYLGRIARYLIFFALGGFIAAGVPALLEIFRRYAAVFLIGAALVLYVTLDHPLEMLFCGIAAIPAFHGLFRSSFFDNDRFFLFLGQHSMVIYLTNSLFMGVFAILLHRLGLQSWPLFALLLLFGIAGPIILLKCLHAIPSLAPVARYLG